MSVLDFSFSDLTQFSDIFEEDPREGRVKSEGKKEPRYPVTTLKLNNNALSSFADFAPTMESVLWDLSAITLLDLSFNSITELDEALLALPNVGVLYLHGNYITSFKEVEKLLGFSNLKSLSLHGNAIEKSDGYRNFVIAMIPTLKKLDFTTVTQKDKEAAQIWRRVHAPKKMARALKKLDNNTHGDQEQGSS